MKAIAKVLVVVTLLAANMSVAFAADGTSTLAGIVPAGLAGHTFVLQAFALDAQGKLLKSIPETIAFQ